MMDIYAIAAASHVAKGEWCSCGETVKHCWFHAVYFRFIELSKQALYDRLFAS